MTPVPQDAVAVLIVDLQNAFCHPDGSFAKVGVDVSGCTAAIAGCVRLVEAGRARGMPVVFTRAVHAPGLADWPVLTELPVFAGLREIGSCLGGSWDAELVEELSVTPGELVLTKSRYSPFVETDLEGWLRQRRIENLVVGGVGTSVCVESTVRDASQRNFRTYVASDATGDIHAASHEASLAVLGTMFGWLTTAEEVVRSWEAAGAPSTSS